MEPASYRGSVLVYNEPMSRTLAFTLAIALPLAAAATAIYAVRAPSFERPAAIRATAADSPSGAASPRAGASRGLSLDEAIKELDLVRPPRPKFADDFTIATVTGSSFRLSAHRGRPVFVNFWATWCPPCLEEMPAMERLLRAQKDAGLVMLAVTVDANPKLVAPFVERHRFTFTVGLDAKMELAHTYGVRALPSSFVIDRDGRLTAIAIGPRAWDNVAAASLIERLAAR
jgi:peroxiredoxin